MSIDNLQEVRRRLVAFAEKCAVYKSTYLLTYLLIWLLKKPIIGPLKSKMAEIRHLENRHDVIVFCRGWSDLDKISRTGAE